MSVLRFASLAFACAVATSAQYPADATVARTLAHPAYRRAEAALSRDFDRFVQDTIALVGIPAPPFKEDARGAAVLRLFQDAGLAPVQRDEVGNIIGWHLAGPAVGAAAATPRGAYPVIILAAHLDTVFPEGTPVHVRRQGTRLLAPGIADDAHGLALLVALARGLRAGRVDTVRDIAFVATVGEEADGDLRGVTHLFSKAEYRKRVQAFVSIDGPGRGDAITTRGVASTRYRATFRGPGGHSYGSFGLVSPALALSGAMQRLGALRVPAHPRTTFNVGTIGGGTAINSIPTEAWMELDLRSESPEELTHLVSQVRALLDDAVQAENRARSTSDGPVRVELTTLGARPGGQTPAASALVQLALAAARAGGIEAELVATSTDANLPMSLGIPAITVESGVPGGRAHTPDEWIDVERSRSFGGLPRTLLLLLSLAGLR